MAGQYYPVGIYTSTFVYYQSLKNDAHAGTKEANRLKHNTYQGASQFLDTGEFERKSNKNDRASAFDFFVVLRN